MKYEQHPEGTGEVLRQLRAEREAFTAFLLEQHERHKHQHNHFYAARNEWARRTQSTQYEALAASKPEPQAQAGKTEAWGVWLDGEPPHPWREEWFIAETIYGDRVVLRYMGDDLAYQYKTADETYMVAKNIKRWMQFPDGQYISAATKAIAKKDAALLACVEALQMAKTIIVFNQRPTGNVGAATIAAAIEQAEEARK